MSGVQQVLHSWHFILIKVYFVNISVPARIYKHVNGLTIIFRLSIYNSISVHSAQTKTELFLEFIYMYFQVYNDPTSQEIFQRLLLLQRTL